VHMQQFLPLILLFAATSAFSQELVEVATDVLILRDSPSRASKIIDKLKNGEILKKLASTDVVEVIDGKTGPWVNVSTFQNKKGYVFGGYLADLPTYICITLKTHSGEISLLD